MNKEYGLLYYDVPSSNINLYYKLKRFVDKTCLPVNLSVYVFDWGLKNSIEQKLKDIGAFGKASVSLVKFDSSSKGQLESLALKQLEQIFASLKTRIHDSVSRLHNIEKRQEYLQRTARRVKRYERLLTLYEFTNRVEPALDLLKRTLDEEWKVCRGKTV